MAFFTDLVAISLINNGSKYEVASQTSGFINLQLLREDGLLNEASASQYDKNEAAIVRKGHFQKYLHPADKTLIDSVS